MIKVSPKTQKTSFRINIPEAESVSLVGEFNSWDQNATPMKKLKSGVWKADLKLEAGEYQFLYLVNGRDWYKDDEAPSVPNIFGTENSIAIVDVRPAAKKTGKTGKSKK